MSRSSTARWEQGLRSGKAKRLIYHAPWSLTDGSLGVDLVGYAGFSRRGRNTSFAALQEPKVNPNRPWTRRAHCNAAIVSPQYATGFRWDGSLPPTR
jgi:hypothetical protein